MLSFLTSRSQKPIDWPDLPPNNVGKLGFNAVNVLSPYLRVLVLPEFDFGKEFFFPVVRNCHQCRVTFHFLGKFVVRDQTVVIGMRSFVFVRATVIVIAGTTPFDLPRRNC